MSTIINVPIPEPLARIYQSATEEEKRKAQWLIELVLNNLFDTPTESLLDVVREISERAEARGMTPEILDELLNDNDND